MLANKKFGISGSNKIAFTSFAVAYFATLVGNNVLAPMVYYRVFRYQNNTSDIINAVAENNIFAPFKVIARQSVHQNSVAFSQFGKYILIGNSKWGEYVSAHKQHYHNTKCYRQCTIKHTPQDAL